MNHSVWSKATYQPSKSLPNQISTKPSSPWEHCGVGIPRMEYLHVHSCSITILTQLEPHSFHLWSNVFWGHWFYNIRSMQQRLRRLHVGSNFVCSIGKGYLKIQLVAPMSASGDLVRPWNVCHTWDAYSYKYRSSETIQKHQSGKHAGSRCSSLLDTHLEPMIPWGI